jgi:hypothetical protein
MPVPTRRRTPRVPAPPLVRRLATTLSLLAVLPLAGRAQSAPANDARAVSPSAAPALQAGVEERFRLETWNDIVDHSREASDHRSQWRWRTRAWASLRFGDRAGVRVGINNESKGQGDPRLALSADETIVESLYLDLKPTSRLSLRVGRQDFERGDGLVLKDGTPGDGSRTGYVNGVTASMALARGASLDLVAFSNPRRDRYLPVINSKQRLLAEWDEQLAGAYFADARHRGLDVQAYLLFKREFHDDRAPTHPQYRPERRFGTLGARLQRAAASGWVVSGEAAGQLGRQAGGAVIRAWASALHVSRRLASPWSPTVHLGLTALSGDSAATRAVEGWDPVLSRWPKWSEAFVNTLGPETGVSYWSNIALWQAELLLAPSKRTTLRATCYHLSAFHPFAGSPSIFGTGTNRGELLEARLDLVLRDELKAHVMYERLLPGSFYVNRDPGYFFRVEGTVAIRAAWRERDRRLADRTHAVRTP